MGNIRIWPAKPQETQNVGPQSRRVRNTQKKADNRRTHGRTYEKLMWTIRPSQEKPQKPKKLGLGKAQKRSTQNDEHAIEMKGKKF